MHPHRAVREGDCVIVGVGTGEEEGDTLASAVGCDPLVGTGGAGIAGGVEVGAGTVVGVAGELGGGE